MGIGNEELPRQGVSAGKAFLRRRDLSTVRGHLENEGPEGCWHQEGYHYQ